MTLYDIQTLNLLMEGVFTDEHQRTIIKQGAVGDQETKSICLFILDNIQIGMTIEAMDLREYEGGGYFFYLSFFTSKSLHSNVCLDLPRNWTIPPRNVPASSH